jgi:hypothetical protein
MEEHR